MAHVYYFGKLSDIAGHLSETIPLPASISDTRSLRAWLDAERGFEGALMHRTVRTAINNEIVVDPHPVTDEDEIAFLPPVGGG